MSKLFSIKNSALVERSGNLPWLSEVEAFLHQILRLRSGKPALVERSRNLSTSNPSAALREENRGRNLPWLSEVEAFVYQPFDCAQGRSAWLRSGKSFLLATFFLLSFFLFSSTDAFAQHKQIDWAFLAQVEWGEKYFEEYDEIVWYPDFGQEVLDANGQLVEIKGYVIPVDVESGYYVLSANPFASCFFCGGAGPESVLELQFPPSMKEVFKMDEIATFRGKLKLNWDDLEHCNYILENATPK